MSIDTFKFVKDLPRTSSSIDFPDVDYLKIVLLGEARLYAASDSNLYVYSMRNLTSQIATIPMPS